VAGHASILIGAFRLSGARADANDNLGAPRVDLVG
jgi:hypothetical protein